MKRNGVARSANTEKSEVRMFGGGAHGRHLRRKSQQIGAGGRQQYRRAEAIKSDQPRCGADAKRTGIWCVKRCRRA